jgi:DNA-directed RNA polymerase subunit RPC12/RpoP
LVGLAKRERPPENSVLCPLCNKPYKNIQCAWFHLKRKHKVDKKDQESILPDFKLKCDQCGKEVFSRTFQLHMDYFHNKGEFPCKDCGDVFYVKGELKNHWQRVHKIRDANYVMKYNIYSPLTDPMLTCDQCGSKVRGQKGLQIHVKRFHTLGEYKCKKCGDKFELHADYKRHRNKHIREEGGVKKPEEGQFICVECGSIFKTKKNLGMHRSYNHNPDPEKKKIYLQRSRERKQKLGHFLCKHCGQYLRKTCLSNKKFQFQHQIGAPGMPSRSEYYTQINSHNILTSLALDNV